MPKGLKKSTWTGPCKWTPRAKEIILQSLENGSTTVDACRAAKISRQLYYSKINLPEEAEFKAKVQEIEESVTLAVEKSLVKAALEGNVKAMEIYLKANYKSKYNNEFKVDSRNRNENINRGSLQINFSHQDQLAGYIGFFEALKAGDEEEH